MNELSPPSTSDRGPRLLRDVLVLVLAGAALGAAFNRMQLATGDRGKGLPWIQQERRLASLEALLADSATAAQPGMAAAVVPPARDTAALRVPPPAPAATAPAGSAPTSRSGARDAPPVASREPASSPTSPPPALAESAPAVVAPAIPETREPLEVQYAIVKQLHETGGALFLDARTPGEFAGGHIPGARNLPFDDVFKSPDLAKRLDSGGRPIVAYCGGGDCELSKSLAWSLIEAGHRRVLVFLGGMAGWSENGNPVSTGTAP